MNIDIYPKKTLTILLLFITTLLLANIVGIICKYYFDHNYVYGLVPLFDFDTEKNIPTLYSSCALMLVSMLLFAITSNHKNNGIPYISWLILAIIFLFLSIDETTMIHERFGLFVRESLNTTGLLYYAWVIPYGIALIIFVLAYLKFLFKLPKKIMILFITSGTIFITGAIGFESFSARQAELFGRDDLYYSLLYTCEELFEMLGIAIFIYTLLTYIGNQSNCFRIINDPYNKFADTK